MSTEAKVTPYEEEEEQTGIANDIAIGAASAVAGAAFLAAAGAVRLVADGLTLDEQQKKAIKKYREEQRTERATIKPLTPLAIKQVRLKLREPASLVASAKQLGYDVVQPPVLTKASLTHQPSMTLTNKQGESFTIKRGREGKMVLEAPSHAASTLQAVVQQHTVDQIVRYKKQQGQSVAVKRGPNGDYMITGVERGGKHKDGTATIKTHVPKSGVAHVDVSGIKGNRCDEIIKGVARAIGGECIHSKKKDAYFQAPVQEEGHLRV